jgi:hypothetical protein
LLLLIDIVADHDSTFFQNQHPPNTNHLPS